MTGTKCPTCGHGGADHSPEEKYEDGSDFWFCFARDDEGDVCGCGDPRLS